MRRINQIRILGASFVLLLIGADAAVAADRTVTSDDILKTLQCNQKHMTRDAAGTAIPAKDCPTFGFSMGDDDDAVATSPAVAPLAASGHARHHSNPRTVASTDPKSVPPAAAPDGMGQMPILFERGSAVLTPDGYALARKLVDPMLAVADARIRLDGHTDATGSAAYNLVLSKQRAEAVKAFLVTQGVHPDRMETVGFGANGLARPDAPNDDANRRVVFQYLPK